MGVQDLGQFTVVVFHAVAFVYNHVLPTDLEERRGSHVGETTVPIPVSLVLPSHTNQSD